jgi:hypothetical protein
MGVADVRGKKSAYRARTPRRRLLRFDVEGAGTEVFDLFL